MADKGFSWSYSALKTFENCGRLYAWKYIEKNKEPPGEKQQWGETVHKALEDRAKTGAPLPASMKPYSKYGDAIDKAKAAGLRVLAEQSYAFTRMLKQTKWFAHDTWLRVKLDLLMLGQVAGVVVDYKTGNSKYADPTQLKIFAAAVFIVHKPVQIVETREVWLDGSKPTVQMFDRESLPWIWNEINPRVERMETAIKNRHFDPKPSGLCKKCPVFGCEFRGDKK